MNRDFFVKDFRKRFKPRITRITQIIILIPVLNESGFFYEGFSQAL